jgi:metal-responsive CopG/Arc/MetJ family transcriptional regulator|tara:strand:- start:1808 stop:1999 length:192 start_codon:yes stop_codon:yes gene_type:complete
MLAKKTIGRPPKYGQPTVRVSVRLPADIAAAIDSLAMAGDSRSDVIVELLRGRLLAYGWDIEQ